MKIFFVVAPKRGVGILGEDPYGVPAAEVVGTLFDTPDPGVCRCERSQGEEPCDHPHEHYVVLERENSWGGGTHPDLWVAGDCGGAYTGWSSHPVREVEVPDGASTLEILAAVNMVVAGLLEEANEE